MGAASACSSLGKLCPHFSQRFGHWSWTSFACSKASNALFLPWCPRLPPGLRPESGVCGRGGAVGASWECGSEELREVRFRRCSRSVTRASRRRLASINSPIRRSRMIAVSQSPSIIASASARSMVSGFAVRRWVSANTHMTTRGHVSAASRAFCLRGARGLNAHRIP